MRIINGKDYYDGAIAYGRDPEIVYVRDNRQLTARQIGQLQIPVPPTILVSTIDQMNKPYYKREGASNYGIGVKKGKVQYDFKHRFVIFCGKLYHGLDAWRAGEHVGVFWTKDRFDAFMTGEGLGYDVGFAWGRNRDIFRVIDLPIDVLIDLRITVAYAEPHFDPSKGGRELSERDEYFYDGKNNLDRPAHWIADGDGLSEYNFQSVFNPVAAFQEISMWVGGTLSSVNGPNTIEITDDKIKRDKHGMDEWSFKKRKGS